MTMEASGATVDAEPAEHTVDGGKGAGDTAGQCGTSRRRGIGAGLKLAAVVPAILAALPLGTAAAGDDSDRRNRGRDDRDDDIRDRLREREDELRRRLDDLRGNQPFRGIRGGQGLRLLKVADADGNDFDKGNAAGSQDGLDQGSVRVLRANGDASGRVMVRLARAQANAVYEVFFLRLRGGRDRIGQLTTNGNGNFDGLVRSGSNNSGNPGRLGGNNRVGVFVLTRDGKDQFVTGFRTVPN
jgi:hypothetical protein